MVDDDKDVSDSWDLYGKYREIDLSKNSSMKNTKQISQEDAKEFDMMQNYINSSDKNELVSNAYSSIIKTFNKDEISKKDTDACLKDMRQSLNSIDKKQYNQMLYWANRCCKYSKKEDEVKKKRATNNFQTYKRFILFVNIRNNSDNENFYHLNRCVNDIESLNIPTKFKIGFVEESQKVCKNENFVKNCQNKNNQLKKIMENEINESIKKFNNANFFKRENLSKLR